MVLRAGRLSPKPATYASLNVAKVSMSVRKHRVFAGIGLTLAGRLRGEINLAAQNGLYLVLLLLGGMVIPFSKLPNGIRQVAHALPSGALADVLRDTLARSGTQPATSWIVLSIWAVAMPAIAAATFRWD